MNPLARPSTPTAAKMVLRAIETPPQDTLCALPPPSASARLVSRTPFWASNASMKPLKSTEYTTPLA